MEISETNIRPEDMENLETGGNFQTWFNVENFNKVKKPMEFWIKNFGVDRVKGRTGEDFGQRIVLELLCTDEYGKEYKLSDWNYATKKKYKVTDLVGKKIKLSPFTDKRVLLEVEE